MKLSIIIPVYNVEPYVEKCLVSCAEQDIPPFDYEIIVINDGSDDRSLEICKQVAKKYSNILLENQQNAGPSAARNKGMSIAKGDYIWFVDSDDWIERNCLKKITKLLSINTPDGLIISGSNFDGYIVDRRHDYSGMENNMYSGKDLLKTDLWEHCVQFTVYKREFLEKNNLRFLEGFFMEDTELTPRAYYFANNIKILNDVVYFKFRNPTSTTMSINPRKAFDCLKIAASLSVFSMNVEKDFLYLYDNIISLVINNSLSNSYQMDKEEVMKLNLNLKEYKYLFKHLTSSTILKYRIEGFVFIILSKFLDYYVQTYKIMQLFNKRTQYSKVQIKF